MRDDEKRPGPETAPVSHGDVWEVMDRHVLDAVVMVGTDSKVIFWNAAAEQMFGYSREDMVGRNMHDFITPVRYRERAKRGFDRFIKAGTGPFLGETVRIEALRSDGSELPVELSISPIVSSSRVCAVAIIRDDTKRTALEKELERLATTDPLTGLLNRRALLKAAGEERERSARYGYPVSVLMLDLDHFKSVNDRYGHERGDEVLRRFAGTCLEILRRTDILGRIGGEEFVILMPHTDLSEASKLGDRLRVGVSAMECDVAPEKLRVTVSIGIALLGKGGKGLEESFQRADKALYEAKAGGRNRVMVAE